MVRKADAIARQNAFGVAPLLSIRQPYPNPTLAFTRRAFLGGATATAAVVSAPRRSDAIGKPRVAIIGAGLAGLVCARELWQHKRLGCTVYEWDSRIGGRVQTLRGYFANEQIAEQHGEFISSEHTETLRLAQHFGLSLENTYRSPDHTKATYWFGGARYTQHDLNRDWQAFGRKLFRWAVRQAPNANYLHHSHKAYAWDHMSVAEWIERHVPGGVTSPFGSLCCADAIDEYGGPPEEQSALNLIYLLGYDDSRRSGYQPHSWPELGGSDEKWHIRSGNDQLPARLAAELPEGTLRLDYRLEAVRQNNDGSYRCSFARGHSSVDVSADHVVLAIPFTTLRHVDLSNLDLSVRKQLAISSLQLGNNAKIHLQVAGMPWIQDGFDGDQLTDAAPDGGWDGSSYQHETLKTEIYVCLPGGADGRGLGRKYGLTQKHFAGPAPNALISDTLAAIEPMFPGISDAWNSGPQLAWVNDGNLDPHILGAWSQYNVGQYTSFGGSEGLPEGNLHFAGEHTSFAFQGYIEGAIRSGQRVAAEITG